jgi:hypothetical protein
MFITVKDDLLEEVLNVKYISRVGPVLRDESNNTWYFHVGSGPKYISQYRFRYDSITRAFEAHDNVLKNLHIDQR